MIKFTFAFIHPDIDSVEWCRLSGKQTARVSVSFPLKELLDVSSETPASDPTFMQLLFMADGQTMQSSLTKLLVRSHDDDTWIRIIYTVDLHKELIEYKNHPGPIRAHNIAPTF